MRPATPLHSSVLIRLDRHLLAGPLQYVGLKVLLISFVQDILRKSPNSAGELTFGITVTYSVFQAKGLRSRSRSRSYISEL